MNKYVFKADHLVLDNYGVCSSLGKAIPPALSIPWLPVVLRLRLNKGNTQRHVNTEGESWEASTLLAEPGFSLITDLPLPYGNTASFSKRFIYQ